MAHDNLATAAKRENNAVPANAELEVMVNADELTSLRLKAEIHDILVEVGEHQLAMQQLQQAAAAKQEELRALVAKKA